eukprot:7630018-Ditylum_brightwellii.AAC.1
MGSVGCGVGGILHGSGIASCGIFLTDSLRGAAGCTCVYDVVGDGWGGTVACSICCNASACIVGTLRGATGGTLRGGAGLGLCVRCC